MKLFIYFLFVSFFSTQSYCMEREAVQTQQSPRSLDSSHTLHSEVIIALSQQEPRKVFTDSVRRPFLDKVKDAHTKQGYQTEVSNLKNPLILKKACTLIQIMNKLEQKKDDFNQPNLDNE